MSRDTDDDSRRRLEQTRQRLERWRQRHGGPGRWIPEELWAEAAELARWHGVERIATTLQLDAGRLQRRVELSGAGGPPDGFVELEAGELCLGGKAVVRREGRDGERVEVELRGLGVEAIVAVVRELGTRRQ